MQRPLLFLTTAFAFGMLSCNSSSSGPDEQDGLQAFSADSLGRHIAVLASDSFMGRKPFTEGETRTTNYLMEQFAAAGLEPGNGNNYFQDVPMVNIATTAAPSMQVASAKGNFTLKGLDDYVIWTDKTDSLIT